MSKVTSVNVLLDMRLHGRQSRGMEYAIFIIRKRLEQLKGVNLYFLLEYEKIEEDTKRLNIFVDSSRIMHLDSVFDDIDVFISSDIIVPDAISNIVEITKYAILDNLLSCLYGRDKEWFEEKAKLYQDNYDYCVVFSNKLKEIYLEKVCTIAPDRVLCYPLHYEMDSRTDVKTEKKLFDEKNKYCLALYSRDYYQEMELMVKGFIKFLEDADTENCNLVFTLAYLDGTDWSYKEISKLFKGHEKNFIIRNADNEADLHHLICEADVYLDTFWLEDINLFLLEELSYGRLLISNSIAVENERVIQAKNSIHSFKTAFKQLNSLLSSDSYKPEKGVIFPTLEKEQILEDLFNVENRKRETPLVTIVTITYNLINAGRRETIQQCLRSVHNQTYGNIEHIIIDGASNDGTLEMLDEYTKKGWVEIFSEKDEGLYDAMNKGIQRAKGKYIAFLNSDDFYHDKYGVEKTVCELQKMQADYAFSDTNILNEDGSIYYWIADIGNLLYARNYCHQSMFTRLDVMKELNGFDLGYRVSSDSDLMIRIYAAGYSYIKVPYSFVTYRGGGLSATTAEESRRDHSYSFFMHLGDRYSLTNKDCYELWQYRFFDELSDNVMVRLIAKIPACFNAEAIINEYMRRKKSNEKIGIKRMIAQRLSFNSFLLSRHMRVRNGRNEMVYYFCKILPIWITKEKL